MAAVEVTVEGRRFSLRQEVWVLRPWSASLFSHSSDPTAASEELGALERTAGEGMGHSRPEVSPQF